MTLGTLVLVAVSCGKSRTEQMAQDDAVQVSCTPEVLTLVGDKVEVKLTVTYPEKYFYPKSTLEVTPVLVYEGGEVAASTFTYQGEKVKDNYKVVSYSGGTVTETFSFDYVDGMETSYLELRSVARYKTTEVEVPARKVADGCNVTQQLAAQNGFYNFKKDNYQDVIRESAEGQVLYDYNSAVVKNSELRSSSVKNLQEVLKEVANNPRYAVAGTRIVSYASPEGGEEYNAKLSDKRADAAGKVWGRVTNGLSAEGLDVQSVGQDWEGFREAVQASDIQDKELIIRVLSMYSDPAVREREIKNMSEVYKEIAAQVFPGLRRARFIADIDFTNYSGAELEELAATDVNGLDEEALLRVASLSSDAERKSELYGVAVSNYDSNRAKFNLAVLALKGGDKDTAVEYLKSVEPDPDVDNMKGVFAYLEGDYAAAAEFFRKSNTYEAKVNLGMVHILQGEYDAAVATLNGTKGCVTAVAYLLTGDYARASEAVDCQCAHGNYIRAVIAARQGDSEKVAEYLALVAEKDSELAARAEKDVEFANYR